MNDVFSKPDIYAVFQPAPERIKKGILARMFPLKYFKYIIGIMLLLFISPLLLVITEPSLMEDDELLTIIFWTESIAFMIYVLLVGVLFFIYRLPYMQQLKDKLGYIE